MTGTLSATLVADHFETDLDVSSLTTARIEVVGGEVAVTATTGTPHLEVRVLDGDAVEVDTTGGTLSVRYPARDPLHPLRRDPHRSVAVTLHVPPTVPVAVRTIAAEVVAAGCDAPLEIHTVSGSVALDGIRSGTTVRTVSGAVVGRALDGPLSLASVSGDLTVTAGLLGRVSAQTVSGDVIVDGDLQGGAAASVSTVSGDVAIRLAADSDLAVELVTMSGHLVSTFDLDDENRNARRLRGRVGDGASTVSVRTMSGDVSLLRREVAA